VDGRRLVGVNAQCDFLFSHIRHRI
jgi:hypothetical protein